MTKVNPYPLNYQRPSDVEIAKYARRRWVFTLTKRMVVEFECIEKRLREIVCTHSAIVLYTISEAPNGFYVLHGFIVLRRTIRINALINLFGLCCCPTIQPCKSDSHSVMNYHICLGDAYLLINFGSKIPSWSSMFKTHVPDKFHLVNVLQCKQHSCVKQYLKLKEKSYDTTFLPNSQKVERVLQDSTDVP